MRFYRQVGRSLIHPIDILKSSSRLFAPPYIAVGEDETTRNLTEKKDKTMRKSIYLKHWLASPRASRRVSNI
jgi:hypothetical protein